MTLPTYKTTVVNKTVPIIQLKYDWMNITATIMSMMVGPTLNIINDNKLLVESVPRPMIFRISQVLRLECHFRLKSCKCRNNNIWKIFYIHILFYKINTKGDLIFNSLQLPVLYIAVLESISNFVSYLVHLIRDLLVKTGYRYRLKSNTIGILKERQSNYQLKF